MALNQQITYICFHLASLVVHCSIRNKKNDRFQQNCKHKFGSCKSLVPPKANIPPWRFAQSILTQQMLKLRLQHRLLLHLWPSRNLHVCLTPISFTSTTMLYLHIYIVKFRCTCTWQISYGIMRILKSCILRSYISISIHVLYRLAEYKICSTFCYLLK